ncbi:unnamed protein product [Ectocarpus sp. CCAP 1310/34]|nr:unnamed protein product [Ectocarpus sp. CCAP 1310/34]
MMSRILVCFVVKELRFGRSKNRSAGQASVEIYRSCSRVTLSTRTKHTTPRKSGTLREQ